MAKAQVTKAQRIRDYLSKNPEASFNQVKKALRLKIVSSELSNARKKLGISTNNKTPVPSRVPPRVPSTIPEMTSKSPVPRAKTTARVIPNLRSGVGKTVANVETIVRFLVEELGFDDRTIEELTDDEHSVLS